MTEEQEQETWKSVAPVRFGIMKFDRLGAPVRTSVKPGDTISVSTDERLYNQARAANHQRGSVTDPFTNGHLKPLTLVDTAEDYAEISDNPNHMDDDDIKAMLKVKVADFKKRVDEIENPALLQRIKQIADENPDLVTVGKLRHLDDKLEPILHPHAEAMDDEAGRIGLG